MSKLSRRRVLHASTALGITGVLPFNTGTAFAQSSPDLEKFVQPLPIPDVREPDGTHNGVDYYEIPLQEFTQKLHPDLPETTLWGSTGSSLDQSFRLVKMSGSRCASITVNYRQVTYYPSTSESVERNPITMAPFRKSGR